MEKILANNKNVSFRERLVYLDVARTFAFIWIVFCWHMGFAFLCDLGLEKVGYVFNKVALGAFFFISGLLLGKRNNFANRSDALLFYKKRLLRIYPLYILAVFTLPSFLCQDFQTRIFAVFGVASFREPRIQTLWFMSLLIDFYILTPLICWKKSILRVSFTSVVVFLAGGALYSLLGEQVDFRLFIYFPIYVLGIIVAIKESNGFCLETRIRFPEIVRFLYSRKYAICGVVALLIICCCLLFQSRRIGVLEYVWKNKELLLPVEWGVIVFGVFVVIVIGNFNIWNRITVQNILSFLSYVSFAGYLFHRQTHYLTLRIFEDYIRLNVHGNVTGQVVCYGCSVICVLIVGYVVQKSYDWVLKRFFVRSS